MRYVGLKYTSVIYIQQYRLPHRDLIYSLALPFTIGEEKRRDHISMDCLIIKQNQTFLDTQRYRMKYKTDNRRIAGTWYFQSRILCTKYMHSPNTTTDLSIYLPVRLSLQILKIFAVILYFN